MENRFVIDWEKYAKLARKAAAEGAVLLKNDNNALPFKRGEKISVFGRIQFDYYKSGTGSGGMVNTKYVVSIIDALKKEDIRLNQELIDTYEEWRKNNPVELGAGWGQEPWCQKEMPLDEEIVSAAAQKSEAAIVVIGRTAGEDKDNSKDAGSYCLTEEEEDMLQKVCSAFERVIVLLNVGNIIDMSWVSKYNPQAVMYVWQGGMEGGNAVADVVMGRVNPCGKLSDTIAYSIEDYPSTPYYGDEKDVYYAEDIFVGYRYFETFAKDKVMYPFGYGLSYTNFDIERTAFTASNGIKLSVKVKNTGNVKGKEVVQVYVNPAQGRLGKPVRNLVAFAKTGTLDTDEEEVIKFDIDEYKYASYDDSGVTGNKSCYVLEAGKYEVYVGNNVRDAVLAGEFEIPEIKVISKLSSALAPITPFKRMHAVSEKGEIKLEFEDAPLRQYDIKELISKSQPSDIPYTGNKGYLLKDVCEGKVSLEDFVAQLSDEDLCCIVRGEGMSSPKVTPGTGAAFGGVTDSLLSYGIPCGCCSDGPSGIRMDCGTYAFSLPNGTCLACSFNEELSEKLYEMEGLELRKNHIDSLLGPGINIHRNPLNGRNFEYFSEDPLLTGKMAAAQLRGMHKYDVTGTIKHFAANNQEFNRRRLNSVVSERALREIYLKTFEIAVKEGDAYMIMSTYGSINGLWTGSNFDLLTTVLRGEWKYDGLVMTDWWADLNEEGGEPSIKNTAAMIRCRNDVYMVTRSSKENANDDNLKESLENGTLTRGALQRSAMAILKVIMKSYVMIRERGLISEEEKQAIENMSEEDKVNFDLNYIEMDEKLVIDGSTVDTSKGATNIYGIKVTHKGMYQIRLRLKIDAGEVAQVPVSFFTNGSCMGTVTFNGTGGEYVELVHDIGAFLSPNNFFKIFFAQSGIQLDTMTFEIKEKI